MQTCPLAFLIFAALGACRSINKESSSDSNTSSIHQKMDALTQTHGNPTQLAWLSNKEAFNSFAGAHSRFSRGADTQPLSWVRVNGKGWIFHYENPTASSKAKVIPTENWFMERLKAEDLGTSVEGPGIYFARNSYSSALYGWDIYAFPVSIDGGGDGPRCLTHAAFRSKEADTLRAALKVKETWPQPWGFGNGYSGDIMAAIATISIKNERFQPDLVSWANNFNCFLYGMVTEWMVLPHPGALLNPISPPAMDAETLPAIISGLDLEELHPGGVPGIGTRFIAMARILTKRPKFGDSAPAWLTNASKQAQLGFLSEVHSPRTVALQWLKENPQALARFAQYTRKKLPQMTDTQLALSGIGGFASAWDQTIFKPGLYHDDLLSFVRTCLESKCKEN